jgi:hypothetical protein
MAWAFPTPAQFKAYFVRDFAYAPASDSSNTDYITDSDIAKAITDARIHFNEGLGFGSEDGMTAAAMNLIAFFLVWSLQTSAKGVGSQVNFPVSSKSVGGVSLSYQIPDRFTKNAFISLLSQNGYGVKFFMLCAPYLIGRVQVAEGTTTPA